MVASPKREIVNEIIVNASFHQSNVFEVAPRQMRTFWDEQSLFEPNKEMTQANQNKRDFQTKNIKKCMKEESKSEIEEEKYYNDSELLSGSQEHIEEEGTHSFYIFSEF